MVDELVVASTENVHKQFAIVLARCPSLSVLLVSSLLVRFSYPLTISHQFVVVLRSSAVLSHGRLLASSSFLTR